MESLWRKTAEIPERKKLHGEYHVDTVVIGAGMSGILTAYLLQQQGHETVILEKDRIAGGQTQNTTAKITCQHGMLYSFLLEKYGLKSARLYADANQQAIQKYAELIEKEHIACHFERVDSYLYGITDTKSLKKELDAAQRLQIKSYYTNHTDLPFEIKGAVCFENQAQFHPLEFLKHLSEKLTIYENTKVYKVKGHLVMTEHGTLWADNIVFASHYPFPIVPGFYFARQHQERSYVMAITDIPRWEGMYYSEEPGSLSFRWYEDILLIGGGAHRTGATVLDNCGYAELKKQVDALYPNYREVCHWSAQDCISHDRLPFIGQYSLLRPYWYVASGFQKWGMTTAMIAANLICNRICHKPDPYESLFTPQRLHWNTYSLKEFTHDIGVSVKYLTKGYLGKDTLKCPHMGCALVWNPHDKTWDCPCHGSRFTPDGEQIDDPAVKGSRRPQSG